MIARIKHWIAHLPLRLTYLGSLKLGIFASKLTNFIPGSKASELRVIANWLDALASLQRASDCQQGDWEFKVRYINRDKDVDRRESITRDCDRFQIPHERFPAITYDRQQFHEKGYGRYVGESYCGTNLFIPGRVCCQISHSLIWRETATSSSWTLCCEDDAKFIAKPTRKIADMGIPEDADFVFCNIEPARGLFTDEAYAKYRSTAPAAIPIEEAAMLKLGLHESGKQQEPGAQGYLLSPKGAAKLIEIWDEMKIVNFTDWTLFFYGMPDAARRKWLQATGMDEKFANVPFPKTHLNGYVLMTPFIFHAEGKTVAGVNCISREELLKAP